MSERDSIFIETKCALCETDIHDHKLYDANFEPQDLSYEVFSARRLPDRLHYRIVRCHRCGLIRSNPVLNEQELAKLYAGSHFTYESESAFAAETYAHYFKKALEHVSTSKEKIRLLEIGCGNGFFLKKARELGVREVFGVEPSQHAAKWAGEFKSRIHTGMFGPGLYPENSFDMICVFQVFDHISQPNEFLKNCWKYLKRDGVAFFINHDIGSLPARLLGQDCPMIDIEHPFLYNKQTFKKIFVNNQFVVLKVFPVVNRYPFAYWLKLAPLPRQFKKNLIEQFRKSWIGGLPIRLAVGNMGLIARLIY